MRQDNRNKYMVWGLAGIVFLLPIYLVRFGIGVPTTLLEVLIYLWTILFLVLYRGELKSVWRELKDKLGPWKWPIIVFYLAAAASLFVTNDLKAGSGLFKAYFIDPLPVLAGVVFFIKEREDYKKIFGAMGFSVILLGIIAALQYFGWVSSSAPWINEVPKRVSGVFEYPNALGLFVAPIAALFSGLILLGKNLTKWEKLFCFIVIILGILAIMLAVSRGALVGFLAGAFIAGVLSKYRKETILIMIGLIVVAFSLAPIREKILSITDRKDISTDVRVVVWKGTERMLEERWLLGAGLGGFPKLYLEKYKLPQHTEGLLYPHNVLLNFWVELGLVGLIGFIWLEGLYFVKGVSFFQGQEKDQGLAKVLIGALLVAMTTLLVHGLVDVPYFKNDLAVMFWVLIGLMIATTQSSKVKSQN